MAKITIGADPELAVFNRANEDFIPAWKITTGEKLGKHEMLGKTGVSIHADGVALEFNYKATSPPNFAKETMAALRKVTSKITGANPHYTPWYVAEIAKYSKEDLEHPLALLTGCDPDYNSYAENPEAPRPTLPPAATKFFGGHIHVGYKKVLCPAWAAVRLIDAFAYMPLLRYEYPATTRQAFYGAAGSYRRKEYGLEYRTPSNFWLRRADTAQSFAEKIDAIFDALETDQDTVFNFFQDTNWAEVQKIVDSRDHDEGARWTREVGAMLTSKIPVMADKLVRNGRGALFE
jgi:hypothetical protein